MPVNIVKKLLIIFAVVILLLGITLNQKKDLTTPLTTSKNQTPTLFLSNLSLKQSEEKVSSIPFRLPDGFVIHLFAEGLGTARDLVFSPGGTLLVSDPSRNTVTALPDKNHDGAADEKKIIVSSGNHVHGLAFYNGKLFVAEVNRIIRYNWNEEKLEATFDKTLFDLPSNSNHTNRTLVFDESGNMYVSVGSTCNVCYEKSPFSGMVIVSDSEGRDPKVFASGQRNAPFLIFHPETHELWATGMGRDHLGDDIPPDEINILHDQKNYGWPICYGDKIHDSQFDTNVFTEDPCLNTEPPLYEIPAHSAPLGLSFVESSQFPSEWKDDLLVAYHGSWNRTIPTGYKVVHLTIKNNKIVHVEDFLTGFYKVEQTLGRPVDLIFDSEGNLYISDDKAGNIYIVQKK